MRKVSVESGRASLKQKLLERGYEVVDMDKCIYPVEAVVYFGGETVSSVCSHDPGGTMLVNAQGLSPDAVADRLDTM